jgi:hypothetical protein
VDGEVVGRYSMFHRIVDDIRRDTFIVYSGALFFQTIDDSSILSANLT